MFVLERFQNKDFVLPIRNSDVKLNTSSKRLVRALHEGLQLSIVYYFNMYINTGTFDFISAGEEGYCVKTYSVQFNEYTWLALIVTVILLPGTIVTQRVHVKPTNFSQWLILSTIRTIYEVLSDLFLILVI